MCGRREVARTNGCCLPGGTHTCCTCCSPPLLCILVDLHKRSESTTCWSLSIVLGSHSKVVGHVFMPHTQRAAPLFKSSRRRSRGSPEQHFSSTVSSLKILLVAIAKRSVWPFQCAGEKPAQGEPIAQPAMRAAAVFAAICCLCMASLCKQLYGYFATPCCLQTVATSPLRSARFAARCQQNRPC